MRIRVSLPAAILALMATPALADIQITVDKTAQTLTVARDGKVLHTWPVSTGRSGRFTPAGNFRAFRMEEDHYSKEFDDAPMPHSIFFTDRGHAIHGSFETKKLGQPASGGCVRLAPANAKLLFEMVKAEGVLKTKVEVTGDERVAIARANHRLSQGHRQARGPGLPPQYAPEDNARRPQPQRPQHQQQQQQQAYYYDGYQWRPYNGQAHYRAAPQPYYGQQPQYYQPRYGYGYGYQ